MCFYQTYFILLANKVLVSAIEEVSTTLGTKIPDNQQVLFEIHDSHVVLGDQIIH